MRLDRISVAGVLRFGEPVTVDFTALPPGLVAVVGANGAGKTTLVEAPIAALYRGFPSRDGTQLVDYATRRDAFIEAVYTVDTRGTFRARINLDGQRRVADAVLVHTGPDGVSSTLNDGKLTTFDEAIARHFPAKDVLLASAVAAQNRVGSFVTLDKRGRKDLFTKLLGLDGMEAMATTARQAGARCEQRLGELGVRQRLLVPEAADGVRSTLEGERQRALAATTAVVDELRQVSAERTRLQAQRDQRRDDAAAHEAARVRLATLANEAAALLVRGQGLSRQRASARTAAEDEDGLLVANLRRQLTDLDARIAKNRGLLARAAEVRAAADVVTQGRILLATADSAITVSHEAGARWQARETTHRRALDRARRAQEDLTRAQRSADRLAGVCDVCTFVADARAAAASIPELQAIVATLPALEQTAVALEAERVASKAAHEQLLAQRQEAQRRVAAAEADAALLPTLEHAEQRIADLQRDRDGATAQVEALRRGVAERLHATVADLDQRAAEAEAAIDACGAATAEAQAEADRTATAATELARVVAQLADLDQRWQTLTADQARLEAQAAMFADRLDVWREKAGQLADVDRQLAAVSAEWREWQLLAKALGRDGLPVLEIDAAGPTVSAFTNDLLAVCFGPRFTVELITQAAKADGKGTKEVFDLRVLDNLRGGDARDLADLSGGEQILVDEALKNALALFINARRAGAIRTCWRDETTSPLDPENTVRYIEMLRRVRALGGFHQILFVSHSEAAQAMADVQVRLRDGQATVHFPPFSEAA